MVFYGVLQGQDINALWRGQNFGVYEANPGRVPGACTREGHVKIVDLLSSTPLLFSL